MKILGLSLALITMVLAGCATQPAPRPADTAPGAPAVNRAPKITEIKELAGTSWVLSQIEGRPAITPPEGWSPLSLEFGREGLRAAGNAGVNRFGGRYTQYDNELTFGPLALTRRLGPAELMAAEQRYTHVLSRVTAWRQEGETLVLATPHDPRAAILERVKPTPAK